MADIQFSCSHCGQKLEADQDLQGQEIECPACSQKIKIPSISVVTFKPERKPVTGRVLAAVFGGFILASLAGNMVSLLLGDISAKEQSTLTTILTGIAGFGAWGVAIWIAVKAECGAKAWRRILIPSAILVFALPIAMFICTGRTASHLASVKTQSAQLEAGAMVVAGGIGTLLMGFLCFFFSAILLTIGLLVGRDKKPNS